MLKDCFYNASKALTYTVQNVDAMVQTGPKLESTY